MKLYTRKGDTGQTDLLGDRVRKDDPRIDLIGDLDETTSSIGLARALARSKPLDGWLIECQRDLYRIMAELAFTDELRPAHYTLDAGRVDRIEALTDELGSQVELSPEFVLPGETPGSAALDVARTVTRRAERHAVALAAADVVRNPEILRYLNRLSSFLFIAARYEEQQSGTPAMRARDG
jgi:cob(I)alamin adenosyltransferase